MTGRTYCYTARTGEGAAVRGLLRAADENAALAVLGTRPLFVTSLRAQTTLRRTLSVSLRPPPGRHGERLVFLRGFSTLVAAGVPMRQALEVCAERCRDATFREALHAIQAELEHGSPLAHAVARQPQIFPPLTAAMIGAGETGGMLDEVLERLAISTERDAELRKKLRAALAYPATVLACACALVLFLIVRIVPMFAQLFRDFRVQPPPSTALLLALAESAARPQLWLLCAVVAAACGACCFALARSPAGALVLDHARLRAPVAGAIVAKSITARLARTLADLLRSGLEMTAALAAVRPLAGSPCYARALDRIDAGLREGEALSTRLAGCGLFDPLLVALVRIGEETGSVDRMLLTAARYFESDVDAAVATMSAAIEPAVIATLGIVVGSIVFSIFIPLYSLIGSVSQ